MNFSAVDFSELSSSIHMTALLLGAVGFLVYMYWPTLIRIIMQMRSPNFRPAPVAEGCKADEADVSAEAPVPSRLELLLIELTPRSKPRRIAAAVALFSLFIGLTLYTHKTFIRKNKPVCPREMMEDGEFVPATSQSADSRWRGAANGDAKPRSKWMQAIPSSQSSTSTELPSELLARSHASDERSLAAMPLLEACATWVPVADSAPPPAELYAQLQCGSELLKWEAVTHEATPALLFRARAIMSQLQTNAQLPVESLQAAQIKFAHISNGVFQVSCKAVTDDMRSARTSKDQKTGQGKPSVAGHIAALRSLKRQESPFREALSAMSAGLQILETRALEQDENATAELDELKAAQAASRSCSLQALHEGRNLALTLPANSALVKRFTQCRATMLEAFQNMVLSEAAKAKDAATLFTLGVFYSDVALAAEQGKVQAPFFGRAFQPDRNWNSEPNWAADEGGAHAPSDVVQAESLMKAGEEASTGADMGDRAAVRALRLYQHAKMLALKHHDSAAEWRYHAAAKLAAEHRRQKLASHALGRLSYFLSLRGRKEEALEVSAKSLQYGEEDPLAVYLQASLRRSLGELKTNEDVEAAEKQLSAVAGKLPSKALEDQRAAAYSDLTWWRLVATEGLHHCFRAWDAAQMLVCIFSGIVFDMPGSSTDPASTPPQ